jgi:hypothetical protein
MENIYTPKSCPLDPTTDCKVESCRECNYSKTSIMQAIEGCNDFDAVTKCEECMADPCPHDPDTWGTPLRPHPWALTLNKIADPLSGTKVVEFVSGTETRIDTEEYTVVITSKLVKCVTCGVPSPHMYCMDHAPNF